MEGLLRVGPRHPTWCLSSLRLSLFVGLGASDTEVVQVCMSERAPAGLVFVGILLASIGACTSGLGMNLMKASSRLESHRPLWRRYRWIAGVALACWVNTALDTVAFALAPLSVIAPIGGLTIVVSVMLARCGWAGEREPVVPTQWVAIGAVVGGVAVVDLYGPHPDPQFNTTEVLQHFYKEGFVAYQVLTVGTLTFLYGGMFLGLLGGPYIETTITAAVAGGMCSGITQTMMKIMATCFGAWVLNSELPFDIFEFWVAVSELTVVAFILLHVLNVCISSANLAISTPLYQVMVILFTIVAGCAFYGDLAVATRSELLMFMLGVICVLSGLGVLISMRETHENLVPTKEKERDPKPAPTAEDPDTDVSTTSIDVLVDEPEFLSDVTRA